MDPLLTAAALSATMARCTDPRRRESEDAFYERHGGRLLRRALPAVPAAALAIAITAIVVTGIIDV